MRRPPSGTPKALAAALALSLATACVGCSAAGGSASGTDASDAAATASDAAATSASTSEVDVQPVDDAALVDAASAVNFDHKLDTYQPKRTSYNFYFTYKLVHPWWDAVAMGMEDAVKQYEERGISVTYEYLAPATVSAEDQEARLRDAASRGFDVIGVDVADVAAVTPTINELIDAGEKVMTFSSSDATAEEGCERIAYVGNTHNYEDGVELTEALCERLGYSGKVAILVGDENVLCHEDRARGAQDVIARYEDMEVVEVAYDHDSAENAYDLTEGFLAAHDDLAGIVCCNMSNPVGAAEAVVEAGLEGDVTIVGMDHDIRSLRYLRDGVIWCLGIQDCCSIGFDTIQVAVKIADGNTVGGLYPEKTDEATTLIYQGDATAMLELLYGEVG